MSQRSVLMMTLFVLCCSNVWTQVSRARSHLGRQLLRPVGVSLCLTLHHSFFSLVSTRAILDICLVCCHTWGHIGTTRWIRLKLCFQVPSARKCTAQMVQPFFAQVTAECPYALQLDTPFPLKIAPSHVGISTSMWYLVPSANRSPQSKRQVDLCSVFEGSLVWQTDRQTMVLGR